MEAVEKFGTSVKEKILVNILNENYIYKASYKSGIYEALFFEICPLCVISYEPRCEKTVFCINENKDADQLCGNRTADQRLCFRYMDGTIPLLPKSEISSF